MHTSLLDIFQYKLIIQHESIDSDLFIFYPSFDKKIRVASARIHIYV